METIPDLAGLHVQRASEVEDQQAQYALVHGERSAPQIAVLAESGARAFVDFEGTTSSIGERTLLIGPLSAGNAEALRSRFSWLRPSILGLRTTAGLGDRLGLATPGHLRAVRDAGGHIAPLPAQQSIREMVRTGRSPQQVMDDAMWGVFAEGWRSGTGADADHLKTPQDIDVCLDAGYTFFTLDPSEHVDHTAQAASAAALSGSVAALPWQRLHDTPEALRRRYLDTPVQCEEHRIAFDELTLARAAVKYGRAVAHVADLYQHLEKAGRGRDWEVEVSVDETEEPTTQAEHVYIATELRRLGVRVISLAPRFVGRFEKGVDYIGDVELFASELAAHAAIARTLGPYKISLHSGSDKFSIYAVSAECTRGMVHLKTAGTSYLEALRTIAVLAPETLRDIYRFARERYDTDRATYHVSALLERAPTLDSLDDAALPGLLEQFDARQILHVTFGSVLTAQHSDGSRRFYDAIVGTLVAHPEEYAETLRRHFLRHLSPFAPWSRA